MNCGWLGGACARSRRHALCARAPSLTSVHDSRGGSGAGDMMFDGVIPLGEALRPLGLSGPSTWAWRAGGCGEPAAAICARHRTPAARRSHRPGRFCPRPTRDRSPRAASRSTARSVRWTPAPFVRTDAPRSRRSSRHDRRPRAPQPWQEGHTPSRALPAAGPPRDGSAGPPRRQINRIIGPAVISTCFPAGATTTLPARNGMWSRAASTGKRDRAARISTSRFSRSGSWWMSTITAPSRSAGNPLSTSETAARPPADPTRAMTRNPSTELSSASSIATARAYPPLMTKKGPVASRAPRRPGDQRRASPTSSSRDLTRGSPTTRS